MFTFDEHPRETSIEKLGKLPPIFKENGTVSAGNASVSFFTEQVDHCYLLPHIIMEDYTHVYIITQITDKAYTSNT